MEKKTLVLCIIRHEGRILLGRKKKGMGKGRWSGPGGHVENGETVEVATIREVKEEVGLDVHTLHKAGFLAFKTAGALEIDLHIFLAKSFQGDPTESDEMAPEWFTKDELPFMEMWPTDVYWWPYLLKNRLFTGEFELDENDRVISHDVKVVATLPA